MDAGFELPRDARGTDRAVAIDQIAIRPTWRCSPVVKFSNRLRFPFKAVGEFGPRDRCSDKAVADQRGRLRQSLI